MSEKTDYTEFDINKLPEPTDLGEIIVNLMVNPNLSPLNYFNDFTDGGSDIDNLKEGRYNDSNFFNIGNGQQFMTMTTHAMHHHLESDPQKAAEILVSRAARKMICYGARPLGLTALLYHINYADVNGNAIAKGIKTGIENAANVFGIQVSDRKIRFDHFGEQRNNAPTLIVTLVGSLFDKSAKPLACMDPSFKSKGHNIFLLGRVSDDLGTSDYLQFYHGITDSPLPEFDLKQEASNAASLKDLIAKGLIDSAAPVAKGGVFFTLMRSGWIKGLGFDITTAAETRIDSFLFGEAMGRVIVSVSPDKEDDFVDYMYETNTPYFTLGHVTKGEVRIDDKSYGYIDKMSAAL